MSEPFTESLRAASEPGWSHAVGHRFVKELFAGAVPDAVMARYLIQDHRFLDSFLTLLGAALASADTFDARPRFGRFIGMVSGEESTYFLRAFEALGVTEARRAAHPDTETTAGSKAIMPEAAETRSCAVGLSVLRRRAPGIGGCAAEDRRYRQRPHADPGRTGQGWQRSVCHAVAAAVRHAARLLARGPARPLAVSRS